jgi:hypothetical protein
VTEQEEDALSLSNVIQAIQEKTVAAHARLRRIVGDRPLDELTGEERFKAENAHGVYTGLLDALTTARLYRL